VSDSVASDYAALLRGYLSGGLPLEEFSAKFFRRFKNEQHLGEELYCVLDELFGDLDSVTEDPQLLSDRPEFYLNEQSLRKKLEVAVRRLTEIEEHVATKDGGGHGVGSDHP
jgi:hypothetical protein